MYNIPACPLRFAYFFALAGLSGVLLAAAAEPGDDVLRIARSLKDGGGYKWEGGSGVPEPIEFAGSRILAAQPKGTYCSGVTFTVAMRAAADRGLLEGKSVDAVRQFQKQWYGSSKESAEKQCAMAVEVLGIGREVRSLDDAWPGDFVQLWRTNKSGHSVVLVELIREGGRLIGLRYRSSQKSTNGIGDRVEYFADTPGRNGLVIRERAYVARLDPALQ
jgi:hypothetical protein